METIGFIGTGNMAKAIICGMLKSKEKFNIIGYDLNKNNYPYLKELNVKLCDSLKEVVNEAKYVVLAVKPQNYVDVLNEMKDLTLNDSVLISIAAGIDEKFVSSFLKLDVKFIQVMPNTPIILGCGAIAICKGNFVENLEFDFAKKIFSLCGEVCVLDANLMNYVIPINGSSPAFIYYFAKGFLNFAENNNIEKEKALKLFCNSLIGSAKMMLNSNKDVDELIKEVTSKKGTTEKGLEALKQNDFLKILEKTCEETAKRAFELSK